MYINLGIFLWEWFHKFAGSLQSNLCLFCRKRKKSTASHSASGWPIVKLCCHMSSAISTLFDAVTPRFEAIFFYPHQPWLMMFSNSAMANKKLVVIPSLIIFLLFNGRRRQLDPQGYIGRGDHVLLGVSSMSCPELQDKLLNSETVNMLIKYRVQIALGSLAGMKLAGFSLKRYIHVSCCFRLQLWVATGLHPR